jgi:regulator of protease activity HflC (stomatin/prohibitin superfamily)
MTFGEVVAQLIGWLGDLVQWILSWFPRMEIIPSDELGVRQVAGAEPTEMRPGIHWYIPALTDITTCHSTTQVMGIRSLALETQDGVAVQVGGVLVYHIEDPVVYCARNYNAEDSLHEVALAAFREAVQCSTWEELTDEGESTFDVVLPSRMAESLARFGVVVESVSPTDTVRLDTVNRHFGVKIQNIFGGVE